MRRDDTDIFADKNEGKVLIMDNPFVTDQCLPSADPADGYGKKRATHSLSALPVWAESPSIIVFDNIYVLNLIAASLRGGTQYLKAEHKRGKEPDELVTARIEVGIRWSCVLTNQVSPLQRLRKANC